MVDAYAGIGTLIKLAGNTIGRVRDISGPGLTTDVKDVTYQDAPDFTEVTIPTLKRLGEVTFPINYIPTLASHNVATGLLGAWKNRTKESFTQTFSDGSIWAFDAYVVKVEPKAPIAGELTMDVSLRLAGGGSLVLA